MAFRKLLIPAIVCITTLVFSCSDAYYDIFHGNMTNLVPGDFHRVNYDGNGATGGLAPIDLTLYIRGQAVTVMGNPLGLALPGFSLVGWNTAADGSGTTYTMGMSFTMENSDVALYAVWTALPTYPLIYDGNTNNGGVAPGTMNYYTGQPVTVSGNDGAPPLYKTGNYFTGWNDVPGGTGTPYTAGMTFFMGSGALTLYAQWSVSAYTLTYLGNNQTGGIPPGPFNYNYNSPVVVQNNGSLYKNGYDFDGWNENNTGTGTDYPVGMNFSMPAGNLDLYAKWDQWPAPTVSAIAPIMGAPGSTVWVQNLAGSGFRSGATVRITNGIATISATGITVVSDTQISCTFNLAGAAAGQWDVVVENLGGLSGTLTDGFTVQGALFREDFESGSDGWVGDGGDNWGVPYGSNYHVSGGYALGIEAATNWNYYDGVHYVFGGLTPTYIRFYIRSSWDLSMIPYINFGGDNTASTGGAIFYRWDGTMTVEGGGNVGVTCCTYHLVEFRNINFGTQRFDFYVDGNLVTASVPFNSVTASITRLYISLGWYAQTGYIDDIEMY